MRKRPHWENYRKRPVVVQAIQYSRASRDDIIRWSKAQHTAIDDDGGQYETAHLMIPTLEGHHIASLGDWIVCGVKGEFYPVKPDIFDMTYDHAPSSADSPEAT